MNYSTTDIIEMVENDWDIGGEVVCEYSDDEFDEFDVEDEGENVEDITEVEDHERGEIAEGSDLESATTCSSTTTTPITVFPCTVPCQPRVSLPHTLLGIFHLLFTPSLLNTISEQTNLYARQVLSDDAYKKFHEVTPLEIQAYLGFMILMGINKLPCIYDYWKQDPSYHYSPIADRIPRARFIEISRFLHFTDNASNTVHNTDPLYDRLWKIRPVINSLSKKFLEVYNPHSVCSIDEAMIRFKGRSTMKQYLPQKPSTGHTLRHYVDFRIELARQLIGDYNSRKQKGRPSSIVHCPSFSVQHFPMKAARRSKCSHCLKY